MELSKGARMLPVVNNTAHDKHLFVVIFRAFQKKLELKFLNKFKNLKDANNINANQVMVRAY